jgi:nucleotide-binding universal stress UspA family protein
MKVLLALECSETGAAAAEAISPWAVENRADVHLFTVLHPKDIHETVGSSGYAHTTTPQGTPSGQLLSGLKDPQGRVAEDRTQALERAHAERRDYLSQVVNARFPGLNTEVEVFDSTETAEAIVDAADRIGADFIAMATRGKAGIGQALFGTIHEDVVRHAHVPVLLVGPGAKQLQGTVQVKQ